MNKQKKKLRGRDSHDVFIYCDGCLSGLAYMKKMPSEEFDDTKRRLKRAAKVVGWKGDLYWFCPRCIRNGRHRS